MKQNLSVMRASNKTSLFILAWTLFLLEGFACQAAPAVISVVPADGKVMPSDLVQVQCSLVDPNNNASVLWYRCQGDICYKIGIDNVLTLNNGDVGNKRYSLGQVDTKDNTRAFKLTLTDAKMEDSATFQCRLSTGASVKAAISVCSDKSSQFCDCIANKGWASPDCFTSQLNKDYAAAVESSWNQVVGLIIALCVVVGYSIVLILVEKRKSLRQCCSDEQSEDERKLSGKSDCNESDQGQVDPSDSASDSATCSTSDPSSSGGSEAHGSTQSRPILQSNNRRVIQDQQPQQERRNRTQKPDRKAETSFVVTPTVHYNQGYMKDDGDIQPQADDNREKNTGHQTNYLADVGAGSLAGHGAIGGQPETPFRYNLSNRSSPQLKRNEPKIVSEFPDADPNQRNTSSMYSSQALSPYVSQGSLSVAGTEI